MTPIEFHFVSPDGTPIANTEIEIQLAKSAFDNETSGVLMPRPIFVDTDAQGKATVPLWPNPSMYYVSVYDRRSAAGLSYKFLVPETEPGITLRLQDIVVQGPAPVDPWEDAVILQVLEAKASSIAAMAAAQAARDLSIAAATSAQTDAMNAGLSVTAALGHRNAAADFATMADQDAIAANTAREEAENASTQAGISAGEAAASAAAVDGVVDEIPDTVYSTMVAALREGTNVDLTFDGVAKTVTINATVSDGPEQQGPRGYSAYEVAVSNGYIGTETDWLLSLDGSDGEDGEDGTPGASAYQLAVADGYVGTLSEWIASLKGAKGDKGDKGDRGNDGTGGGEAASAASQHFKVSPALAQVHEKPVRVLISGTSIASFDRSSIQIAVANLQRIYGQNKTQVVYMASLGGDYNQDGQGRQKQVYGGAPYIRLALKPADPAVTVFGFGSKVRVVYGKELDGGLFTVNAGATPSNTPITATLDSSGSQQYENIWEYDFGVDQRIELTISGPLSGWAYIERVEFVDEGPGIFVENATMGGGGLANTMIPFGNPGAGNKPVNTIEGFNGVDAWFDRQGATKPDLIMVQHFTNDNADGMAPPLARLATTTKLSDTPVVLVTEMPAVSFITAEGELDVWRTQLRDLILSYGSQKNIAIIDWIAMMDFSDKAWYEAQYYTGGDTTHPMWPGYAPTHGAFADLFNVPHPGVENMSKVAGYLAPVGSYASLNDFKNPVSNGLVRVDSGVYGGPLTVMARAKNIHHGYLSTAVYAGGSQPNLLENFSIGPDGYAEAGNIGQIRPLTSLNQGDLFTVVLLAQSDSPVNIASISMTDNSNNEMPEYVVVQDEQGNSKVADNGISVQTFYLPNDKPVFVFWHFRRRTAAQQFLYQVTTANLRVFGAWAVEGQYPIVTPRKVIAPYVGFPVFYNTAPGAPSTIPVGQLLYPLPGSRFKERVKALDMVVYQPLTKKFTRGFELLNRNADGVFYTELEFNEAAASSVVNPRVPGLMIEGATDYRTQLPFACNGQEMTLSMRIPSHIFRIRMLDSGWDNQHVLNAAGQWIPGNGVEEFPRFNTDSMNGAFTFNLPTGAEAAALGSNPRFVYDTGWGGNLGVAVLVSGPFPCVSGSVETGDGANGLPGADGEDGEDGLDGTQIHIGNAAPANPVLNSLWLDTGAA